MHRFRSRISVVILLFLLAVFIPILLIENSFQSNGEMIMAYTVLFGSSGLILFVFLSLNYQIDNEHLTIHLGPFSYQKIKISDIEKVERSYNPLSSPAASLTRLYIRSKEKDMLISPADEDEFIRLLLSRNRNIQVNITNKGGWWRFWNWDV